MNPVVIIALAALGNYAVTQSVTRFDGVGRSFERLRRWDEKRKDAFTGVFSCPVCLGWYTSVFAAIVAYAASGAVWDVLTSLVVYFAIVGLNILLSLWSDK